MLDSPVLTLNVLAGEYEEDEDEADLMLNTSSNDVNGEYNVRDR